MKIYPLPTKPRIPTQVKLDPVVCEVTGRRYSHLLWVNRKRWAEYINSARRITGR